MQSRSWTRAGAALALAAAVSGCRAGSPDVTPTPSASSPTPPPSPTPPSPTPTFDQSTPVAAYRAFYAALVAAGRTADWQSLQSTSTATVSGSALRVVVENLRRHATRGETLRGTIMLNPSLERLSGSSATVRDCQDSSGWRIYDRTGRAKGPGTSQRTRVVARLVRTGGIWKVHAFISFDRGAC